VLSRVLGNTAVSNGNSEKRLIPFKLVHFSFFSTVMSHDEQLPSLNEQFKHLKSQLPVKPEPQRWKQELDSLAREICKELSAQGQVPLMERWRDDMIKLFGVGYSQKDQPEPLNACIKNAQDYNFLDRCLKTFLNTLHNPTRKARLICTFVLNSSTDFKLYHVQVVSSSGDDRNMTYVLALSPEEMRSNLPSRSHSRVGRWGSIVPARTHGPPAQRRSQAQYRPRHSLSHRGKISSRQFHVYGLSSCEECGKNRRGGEGEGICFV